MNGATSGTNFGDLLFAHMFQSRVFDIVGEENVFWYSTRFSMSEFFLKSLRYQNKAKIKDMEALVYISGGYFCGNDRTIKDRILRVLRYFSVGLKCIRRKIPYCIIGLEVAIPQSKWLRRIEKKILRKAALIVVRNHESMQSLRQYGIDNAIESADTAFAIETSMFEHADIPEEISRCECKKLLLHINPGINSNETIKARIIPIVNAFLKQHSEYAVLVTADQYSPLQATAIDDVCRLLCCDKVIKYHYSDPFALCKVISCVDTIVTHKLHVGLIGAKLGKSVISFSGHTEKIQRLYHQLGEDGRSTPIKNLTQENGLSILEEYYDKPIIVSETITSQAKSNFVALADFLIKVKKESNA